MRNLTFVITVLVVLVVSSIVPSSVSAQHFGNFRTEPTNRLNLAFRAFDRVNEQDATRIAVNGNNNQTILNGSQASELGGGLGVDLNYIFSTDYGTKYEIRGFFTDWDTTNTRTGANLTTPSIIDQPFRQIETAYDSTMFSLELNQRRDLNSYFTSIIGIRYMSLEESFVFTGQGNLVAPNPPLPLTVTNTTETSNPMLGFQIGGESRYALMAGIHLDVTGKAGVFSNSSEQRNISDTNFTSASSRNGSNNDATVLGEFSFQMHYDLILDRASLFLGYDAIYLQGVAIAPRNVQRNDGVDDDEDLLFNGIRFGFSMKR